MSEDTAPARSVQDEVAGTAPSLPAFRAYAYAALVALATLATLLLFAPDPAAHGVNAVTADRIMLMAPGEQHQARHPASANWALGFADQFRFARETARQRAAHVGEMTISPEERQWHFSLTEGEATNSDLALFIANAAGDLTLLVNGTRIAQGQRRSQYGGAGVGGTQLAAPLNRELLNVGLNRVDVLQSADPLPIGIAAIWLGPRAAVAAAQSAFTRWLDQQQIAAAMAAIAGLIGALVLALAGRQQIPALAFAALAMVNLLDLFPIVAPHPALAGAKGAATLGAGWAILWCRQRPHDAIGWLLLGLAIPAVLGGIAVLFLAAGAALPPHPFAVLQLAGNGARPLVLIGVTASILRDGKTMMDGMRQLRTETQRKDRIIDQQQRALDAEIRHAAVLEERQRFARDMHDGIGGQLQGLLMRVRANRVGSGDIAEELQSGLADLRLMVDSLDQPVAALDIALDNFRVRAAPQLDAAGITLHWTMAAAIREATLDPPATLNLYRILQEMVANCVRHSRATHLEVVFALSPTGDRLDISASDDGCGFASNASAGGRGLANLRQRAAQLGGTVAIASAVGAGTRIALSLPISREASEL